MRILNLFIAFSCVMLVFIMAGLFSNFYIKDKGFSFSQNLYDSTKILPDVFTSTPRFFQSASLANKTRLSKEEKEYIKEQIRLRAEAKKLKNYTLADEIRNKLLEKNIVLMDTADGVLWEKIDE